MVQNTLKVERDAYHELVYQQQMAKIYEAYMENHNQYESV